MNKGSCKMGLGMKTNILEVLMEFNMPNEKHKPIPLLAEAKIQKNQIIHRRSLLLPS